MKPISNPFLIPASLAAIFLMGAASSTYAASFTWDANGGASGVTDGAGTWSNTTGSLWWDGAANSIWTNTGPNDAIFGNGNGAAGSVAIGTAITVGNLTFNSSGSGKYTLTGAANSAANTLTLSGATTTITTNQSATISARISSTNGFVKEGLGSLTLNGSTATGTVNAIGGTITVNAGQLVVAGSPTFGGDGAFQSNLTLANFGRFTLSASNIIGNSAQITAGADAFALFNNTDTIGALAGSGRISSSSTLTLTSGTQDFTGVLSGAGGLTINGAGIIQTFSGANLFTGNTTATSGTLALNNVNALQNSTLSKGSGTVTFTVAGTNTYNLGGLSGATALNIGANTISVGGNNANTAYSASIGVTSAAGGLTKVGTGTLTLSGASIYTGATTVSRGTLELQGAGSLASSGITFNGTGGFTYTGVAAGSSDSVGALTRTAGNGTITSTYGTSGNTALTFTSLSARTAGATSNFVVTGGSNGTTNKIVLTGATANAFIDQGTFFGGSEYAWYDGTGYVRAINYNGTEAPAALTGQLTTLGALTATTNLKLTGATGAANTANGTTANSTSLTLNSATGFLMGQPISGTGIAADTYITAVAGNVLTLSKAATVTDTTSITSYNSVSAQTTGALNTLNLNSNGASVTLAGSQTLTVNGVLRSGGTTGVAGVISGGSGIQAASGQDLVVRADLAADSLIVNTPIKASGTNALVKTGAGDLTLGSLAVNTYTGGTFVNQGKLIVNQDNNLGSTAAANNIRLNGGTLQPSASFTLNANHGIDVNAGGGTINGNGFQLTLGSANMLSGSGPLTITGNGNTNSVLSSGATQDFSGPMTISSGRIILNAANLTNPYGTGDITIGSSGSIYIAQSESTWANRFFISSAGGEGRGAIRAQNGGTFNGDIILGAASTISSDGASGVATFNGNISGAFTLTLNGTGSATTTSKVNLTGNNVHNATTVARGITNIDHDIALGAYNGTVTINGDSTLQAGAADIVLNPDRGVSLGGSSSLVHSIDTQAFNMTIQGVITGAATETLQKQGAGKLTLTGANTYSGTTLITGGTLQLGNGGSTGTLSTSSAITNNANLTINRSNSVAQGTDFSGAAINGTGSFTQAGSGTTTLSVANGYIGATTVTAGTLVLADNSAAGTAAGGIALSGASAATLQINAGITTGDDITFSNTNAASSVKRVVGAGGAFTTGTSGVLTSSFAGGQADTIAQILAGTSALGTTLTMGFSDSSTATNDGIRRSDVFSFTGSGGDVFAFQLSTIGSDAPDSVLGWNDNGAWFNAVIGNTGAGVKAGLYAQSFAGFLSDNGGFNATTMLGAYGYHYDSGSGTRNTWAVLNHNSEFAMIPEPSTALAGLLLSAGLLRRRRK